MSRYEKVNQETIENKLNYLFPDKKIELVKIIDDKVLYSTSGRLRTEHLKSFGYKLVNGQYIRIRRH